MLTVDPARRLANALGLEGFGNVETRVPPTTPSRRRASRPAASCGRPCSTPSRAGTTSSAATPPTRPRQRGSWPTRSTRTSPGVRPEPRLHRHGAALRDPLGGQLRPDRRRHPADAQRPRLPRGARAHGRLLLVPAAALLIVPYRSRTGQPGVPALLPGRRPHPRHRSSWRTSPSSSSSSRPCTRGSSSGPRRSSGCSATGARPSWSCSTLEAAPVREAEFFIEVLTAKKLPPRRPGAEQGAAGLPARRRPPRSAPRACATPPPRLARIDGLAAAWTPTRRSWPGSSPRWARTSGTSPWWPAGRPTSALIWPGPARRGGDGSRVRHRHPRPGRSAPPRRGRSGPRHLGLASMATLAELVPGASPTSRAPSSPTSSAWWPWGSPVGPVLRRPVAVRSRRRASDGSSSCSARCGRRPARPCTSRTWSAHIVDASDRPCSARAWQLGSDRRGRGGDPQPRRARPAGVHPGALAGPAGGGDDTGVGPVGRPAPRASSSGCTSRCSTGWPA